MSNPKIPAFALGFCLLAILLGAGGCTSTPTSSAQEAPPPEGFESRAEAASYHLLLAEMALQKELFDVAVDEYRQAALLSDNATVASRATELAFELGRDDDALVTAQRWAELDPEDIEPHRYLARLYVRSGQPERAAESLHLLLADSDASIEEAFLPLSSMLLQERDAQGALAAMEVLADGHEDLAQAQYSIGVLALRAGEMERALEAARRATELSPDWAHANLLYARVLIASGDVDAGIAHASERIGGQNSTSERLEYGILLAAIDRDEEARIVLRQVLSDDNTNAGALRALGLLNLKEGDLDTAQANFQALLGTGRSTYDAFFYLASIAESKKQFRRAIRMYAQVISGPNAVPAQLRVARLMADSGEVEEGIMHLERFAAGQPRFTVDMALGQGEILMDDGQLDRALTLYDDVLAAYPDDSRVQYSRAFLLEDMDRVDDALHQLRLILARNPNDASALNALGYTLADRTDQIEEAYELIKKAYELQPDSPAIIDSLGWVQYKRGELTEARDLLERAYGMFADSEIASHLGEVMWKLGNEDGARSLLEEAIGRDPENEKLLDIMQRIGM